LTATRQLETIKYDAGTMILHEGENPQNFYIVTKGIVEVFLQREDASDVVVTQLGPGKYFGEMEYFHQKENRASIRASEISPVEVVALDYDELHALLSENESTREALHEAAHKHEEENVQHRGEVK
jgi:CRP-like cAMP-binding protein